jgi:glutamate synthase domain-containing protein 2
MTYHNPPTTPRKSATFDDYTLSEIRRAAASGIFDIRGAGSKRRLPHFDDLLFLGASMSRYPLEGYREKCSTSVVLGTRHAKKPIELKIPITIAGMSCKTRFICPSTHVFCLGSRGVMKAKRARRPASGPTLC